MWCYYGWVQVIQIWVWMKKDAPNGYGEGYGNNAFVIQILGMEVE